MFKPRFSIRTLLPVFTLVGICLAIWVALPTLLDLFLRTATSERTPLSHVGVIAFGDPIQHGDEFEIPITFSGGQWNGNSAIDTSHVTAHVKQREIEICVFSSLINDSVDRGGLSFTIPGDSSGEYSVCYREPDGTRVGIGDVQILGK